MPHKGREVMCKLIRVYMLSAVGLALLLAACTVPGEGAPEESRAAEKSAPVEKIQVTDGVEADTDPADQTDTAGEAPPVPVTEHLVINLRAVDETGANYVFDYAGEEFLASYQPDVWTIYDSYRVTDHGDILQICQALIDEHPIHGSNFESFRTAEDMAFEWEQHNVVYASLSEDNEWRSSVRDVDLDPEDQGKTFLQIYEDRTGRKLDPADLLLKQTV